MDLLKQAIFSGEFDPPSFEAGGRSWTGRASEPCRAAEASNWRHRHHAESIAALERGGLESKAQFTRAVPGISELGLRGSAGDLGILVTVLGALRIAEIIGVELRR